MDPFLPPLIRFYSFIVDMDDNNENEKKINFPSHRQQCPTM